MTTTTAVLLRLVVLASAVTAASALGTGFTRSRAVWVDASSFVDGPQTGAYVFGPAVLIAAFARMGPVLTAAVAAGFGLAMVAMWWRFASVDSSTSALVFSYGWLLGIPVAIGLVGWTWRDPSSTGVSVTSSADGDRDVRVPARPVGR